MTVLNKIPAVLALLLFAAHLLRWGGPLLVLLVIFSTFLLFSQRTWAIRTVQAILGVACLEWLRTAWLLSAERMAVGAPYLRMLGILLGVTAFSAWAAWLAGRSRRQPVAED